MVKLEKLAPQHKEALMLLANDPQVSATSSIEHPFLPDMVEEWIEQNEAASPIRRTFVVLFNGEVAGACSLKQIDYETKKAELSYWIGQMHWGRGLGKSAVRLLLSFAFGDLGLESLRAYCLKTNNRRSLRLLQNVGFQLDLSFGEIKVDGRFAAFFPDDVWTRHILSREVWVEAQHPE